MKGGLCVIKQDAGLYGGRKTKKNRKPRKKCKSRRR